MAMQVGPRRGLKARAATTVASDGTAKVEISPSSSWPWTVRQVSIELTGSTPVGARATLRVDDDFVTRMIATGDTAHGDPPIDLDVGEQLSVAWEGASAGQIARVLVLYDEVRSS